MILKVWFELEVTVSKETFLLLAFGGDLNFKVKSHQLGMCGKFHAKLAEKS